MLRERLEQLLREGIASLQADKTLPAFSPTPFLFWQRPTVAEHGDVATPAAMMIAQEHGGDPQQIAQLLADRLRGDDAVDRAEVAGPGFVNAFLVPGVWHNELRSIIDAGASYGTATTAKGSASVEFISVNPTGELHVAHGRGAFYGDALARILQAAGWEVTREYYVNASHHNTQIEELGKAVLGEGDQYQGPMIENVQKQLSHILANVRQSDGDASDAMEVGFRAAQILQAQNQKFIEDDLHISFDEWVWEEQLYDEGLVDKALNTLKKKKALQEKDGAQWFAPSAVEGFVPEGSDLEKEDDGWVVVRSNGAPSYLLPDIAYHRMKAGRGHDRIIDVLGADHQGHEDKLRAAADLFGFGDALEIVITQMVHILEEGEKKKMSKRAGTAVPLAWLVDEVGLDAVRFLFLLKSTNTHMEFDIAKAKEQSADNPVYYVQYAHTRCAGILRNAAQRDNDYNGDNDRTDLALLKTEQEIDLIKKLSEFPEVIDDIAQNTEVHRLPHYLVQLADVFHAFYHTEHVLGDDDTLTQARLTLVRATKQVFANGLSLLGVSAPEEM